MNYSLSEQSVLNVLQENQDNNETILRCLNESDEIGQRSTLVSRNLTIIGRRTSVRLEPEMWSALKDIARRERTTIHSICSLVYLRKTPESTLTAAIRVFLLLYFRAASTETGHSRVGHGNFEIMKRRARVTDAILLGEVSNITKIK